MFCLVYILINDNYCKYFLYNFSSFILLHCDFPYNLIDDITSVYVGVHFFIEPKMLYLSMTRQIHFFRGQSIIIKTFVVVHVRIYLMSHKHRLHAMKDIQTFKTYIQTTNLLFNLEMC